MAKGTSSSDVHFSIPEGADPLGIGVLDLGRSSYDPIDTIRRYNETRRENRLIREHNKREDYQNFRENMPSVSGINKNIANNINNDILEMSKLFKQQQSLGVFGGLAKTGENKDEKVYTKLSELENKVAKDAPIYQHYSDQYEKDLAVIRNPNNAEKIDWKLTNANVDAMSSAKDVEGFAQPFANNGGSLIVMRPKETDMIGWVKSAVDTFAPGLDTTVLSEGKDPNTGKYATTTLETKDQKRVYDSIIKGYANAPQAVKNQIQRLYDAPGINKKDENGVIMEPDAWYASQFAPEWGRKETTKQTTIDDDPKFDWKKMFGSGFSRNADGTWIMGSPSLKQIDRQRTVEDTSNKIGGTNKKPVYGTKEVPVPEQYYAYTAELSGVIDKPFAMETSTDTYDQQSGERIPAGLVAYEQPTNVSMMPTAKEDITVEMPDGTKETVPKGDPIKKEIMDAMDGQREKIYWDWFVTSASQIKKTTDGGVEAQRRARYGDEYIPTHQVTTIRPWADAENAILSEASGKFDLTEMSKAMAQMKRQKNSGVEAIIQKVKDKTADQVIEELF